MVLKINNLYYLAQQVHIESENVHRFNISQPPVLVVWSTNEHIEPL